MFIYMHDLKTMALPEKENERRTRLMKNNWVRRLKEVKGSAEGRIENWCGGWSELKR